MKQLIFILFLLSSSPVLAASVEVTIRRAHLIQVITKAANQVGVPASLLIAICDTESNLRPSVKKVPDGSTPSYGLCQVKLETALYMDAVYKHAHLATAARLLNPYLNSFYAAKVLQWNLRRYKGNWRQAVDAYNRGYALSTSSKYVKKVTKNLKKGGINGRP